MINDGKFNVLGFNWVVYKCCNECKMMCKRFVGHNT